MSGTIHEHEFGTNTCTYETLEDGKVRCLTCAHACVIGEGQSGICAVRKNDGGVLRLIVYGSANCVNARDPIEKKPLYHVMSGSRTFSMATVGCNFSCSFCQNDDLSQCTKDIKKKLLAEKNPSMLGVEIGKLGYSISPERLVEKALESGCKIMAYTYSEPTIFFEYAMDTAILAKQAGLMNVFKSNGFESEDTVKRMVGVISAVNIDLKAFTDDFYRTLCKARLQPVLDNIKRMHDAGIWVEVTTLFITGKNDSDEEMRQIAEFLVSVDPNIPWICTAFFPAYQLTDIPRTPQSTLGRAYKIGKAAGLKFVYARVGTENSTYCPECGTELVHREGIFGARVCPEFVEGQCKKCGTKLPGVWTI